MEIRQSLLGEKAGLGLFIKKKAQRGEGSNITKGTILCSYEGVEVPAKKYMESHTNRDYVRSAVRDQKDNIRVYVTRSSIIRVMGDMQMILLMNC